MSLLQTLLVDRAKKWVYVYACICVFACVHTCIYIQFQSNTTGFILVFFFFLYMFVVPFSHSEKSGSHYFKYVYIYLIDRPVYIWSPSCHSSPYLSLKLPCQVTLPGGCIPHPPLAPWDLSSSLLDSSILPIKQARFYPALALTLTSGYHPPHLTWALIPFHPPPHPPPPTLARRLSSPWSGSNFCACHTSIQVLSTFCLGSDTSCWTAFLCWMPSYMGTHLTKYKFPMLGHPFVEIFLFGLLYSVPSHFPCRHFSYLAHSQIPQLHSISFF